MTSSNKIVGSTYSELPLEIWHEIMLDSPECYRKMVLVCKSFRIDNAKDKLTRAILRTDSATVYILPCGDIHRGDDLPAVICTDGTLEWYKDNKFHRTGNPAVIYGENIASGVYIDQNSGFMNISGSRW